MAKMRYFARNFTRSIDSYRHVKIRVIIIEIKEHLFHNFCTTECGCGGWWMLEYAKVVPLDPCIAFKRNLIALQRILKWNLTTYKNSWLDPLLNRRVVIDLHFCAYCAFSAFRAEEIHHDGWIQWILVVSLTITRNFPFTQVKMWLKHCKVYRLSHAQIRRKRS